MPFTLATFNTNSVRARLQLILDWLAREQPNVLCLQETKAQDRDFPAKPFEEAGFYAAFKGQKSYNGVALISRYPLERIKTNLYDGEDEEARFISAVVKDIPVINVYIPQGVAPETDQFAYKLKWFADLLSYVKTSFDPDQPLVITGDFNVALEPRDLFDPEQFRGQAGFHRDEQAVMQGFLDWGLYDIFRQHHSEGNHYTFWDYRIPNALKRQMGWRIDYILATAPLAKKSNHCWIDTQARALPKPSDHTFLVAEFDF